MSKAPATRSHWLTGAMIIAPVMLSLSMSAKTEQRTAEQTVQDTTVQFFALMHRERDRLKSDPDYIIDLVHEHIAPYIAFDDMARWALAHYWRDLDAEDKRLFTKTFRDLMIRTYSKTLINYIDSTVTMGKPIPSPRPDFAVVGISVAIPGQPRDTRIQYRMRLKEGHWQVLDITLDGISLLSNYRNTFGDFIARQGIRGLISDMERRLAGLPSSPVP